MRPLKPPRIREHPSTCHHVSLSLSQIMLPGTAKFSEVISVVITIVIQATVHM